MVDQGLLDLVHEKETPESLMVSLAAPRLRLEGVPIPTFRIVDADHRLYRLLESHDPELAHARYLAYLDQIHSFADACWLVRNKKPSHA